MKILIVAHYTQIPSESGNNRFNYISNLLSNNPRHQVELVTSSFSHKFKIQRDNEIKNLNYKLTMIYEPGYKKNVCLRRFYSHYKMSRNLKKYLDKLDYKPDVIYCAVPSLDVAKVTAKYAKRNNIKFIIDVQDLWPEAFKMVFRIPIINNVIFFPMKKKADYIYKMADNIVTVSKTYLNRVKIVNKKSSRDEVVFLGTEMEQFDKYNISKEMKKDKNIIKIVYIGTLGHSYDIKIIIDAIKILDEKGIKNIEFLVMGDGPLRESFEEYAKQKKVNCIFTGILQYNEMIPKLCNCGIAVNPIKKGSAGSIINKVGDYAMAGLPVINTQENVEYRELVEKYQIGYNCNNGNLNEISEKIEYLIKNEKIRIQMGKNNRKLAEEKFDRKKTYTRIKSIIEGEKNDNITC